MALEKFTWENGSQVEPAKVEVEGVSYDVVDAQFEGATPLSAANLNLMQDTLLGNVKDDLSDDTKIPSVKAVKGEVLWTNSNPTSAINSDTNISLSSSDYDLILWLVKETTGTSLIISTHSIKGYGAKVNNISGTSNLRTREIVYNSDTSYTIKSSGYSGALIPIYAIGYKTNLF